MYPEFKTGVEQTTRKIQWLLFSTECFQIVVRKMFVILGPYVLCSVYRNTRDCSSIVRLSVHFRCLIFVIIMSEMHVNAHFGRWKCSTISANHCDRYL